MKTFIFYIYKLLNFIKRFIYFYLILGKKFLAGLNWLFSSNEHTSFTINISDYDYMNLSQEISNYLNIELSKVEKKIKFATSLKMEELISKKKTLPFIDVDLEAKFDYRLLPFIIYFDTEISNLYEFGFNQGRIPFLIDEYIKNNKIFNLNTNYIGIDINSRKGAFCKKINSKKFKFIYDDVNNFLQGNFQKDNFNDSCIVASTHEINSEKAIFEFMVKNQITPKFIISDNVESNSHFMNYLSEHEQAYKTKIFKFSDSGKFLEDTYIGLAVRI
jgi:hypothetical protein